MKTKNNFFREMRSFLILWITQAFSALGSSMTNFALIVWSYQQEGSALTTAMLSVCSYAPYVAVSIFAGALSDRWNKKAVMLICDTIAAACTVIVLILVSMGELKIWYLYCLNAVNGLMNTFQQPASEVAVSLLTPKKYYQRVSGMSAFSNSLVNMLTPALATAVLTIFDLRAVIIFDLFTFGVAFVSLLFFVDIPKFKPDGGLEESVLKSAKEGLAYLRKNRGILDLILFLAAINLTASVFNAALPALILPKKGEAALGIVNAVTGGAMLVGSAAASLMTRPKSRVRVICNSLLIAMCTENFLLALGKTLPVWCIGACLGWIAIPLMNTNLNALMRSYIPVEIQGRVYSARNTLQFFTIPVGYILGGVLIDNVFEPFMATQGNGVLTAVFGTGRGSGTALLLFILAFEGVITCLVFRRDRHIWKLEDE